ncbi:hypothetical protein MUU72_04035 [Streptomyces sp. RS10V-4]|uniref:hypothetical protein n=1 Tax=Streptomyces rhizoryzae TaxID=2932493 RepID=UPI0020061A24|nr:hypothetical protein [Streptomyces rhizoryzae]MCK7622301.1 hypothetical protein [Streptomyces rhizoryzae]
MLFPDPFPDLLTRDAGMAAALTAAQALTATAFPAAGVHVNCPLSVAAVQNPTGTSPSFAYAGFRDTEMHFSGSLLKMAAMLAGFELRQSAADFATSAGDCTGSVVFTGLQSAFDTDIVASAPRFRTEPGITQPMRVPKYPTIFDTPQALASGGCLMAFNPAFTAHMQGMIVPSDNNQASATIQALGYSWINGLLARAGLFDPNTNQGIWLAGTFTGAFPAVRVPSVNDGPSAQATTTIDMTRLLALLIEGATLDARSVDGIAGDMRDLLAEAQSVGDASFLTTGARQGIDGLGAGFTLTHSKIGLGPLNSPAGSTVASEATVLSHDASGQQFLVCWQNLLNLNDRHNAMAFLVRRTLLNFLGIP